MNGRIYDARLGRFLQADIQVDGVTFTQGYNRYSYGHNNPLSGTDPSGYGFFKEFFDDFLGASESPIINAAVQIGLCYFTGGYGNVYYSAAFAGTQTYEYGGSFGQAIGNGIIAGVSAYAFTQVGGDWWQAGLAGGLIGGVTAELQGGNFGHGFASAGIASAFGASNLFGGNAGARFVATMIVGGTASKLTGDKFANGAASSALWFIASGLSRQQGKTGQSGVPCTETCPSEFSDEQKAKIRAEIESLTSDLTKQENAMSNKALAKELHDRVFGLSESYDIEIGAVFKRAGSGTVILDRIFTDFSDTALPSLDSYIRGGNGWAPKKYRSIYHSHPNSGNVHSGRGLDASFARQFSLKSFVGNRNGVFYYDYPGHMSAGLFRSHRDFVYPVE